MTLRHLGTFGLTALLAPTALAQTQLVDFDSSTAVSQLTAFGDGLIARGTNLAEGTEPWISDGTPGGTFAIDLNPGPDPSSPYDFTEYRGRAYFIANRADTGFELFSTDGTAAGTTLVKDFTPGADGGLSQFYSGMIVYDDRLYIGANDGEHGVELWSSDGTTAGTTLVADVNPGPNSSEAGSFFVFQDELYFSAAIPGVGRELWKTDGTEAGTEMVAELNPGPAGSFPGNYFEHEGQLFFTAEDDLHGRELWVTDGTTAGTEFVIDIAVGTNDSWPGQFLSLNGVLYFTARLAGGYPILYTTDGTESGTTAIYWANQIGGTLAPVGDEILFVGRDPIFIGTQTLLRYDPQTGTTTALADLSSFASDDLVRLGDDERYTFIGTLWDGPTYLGREIWTTDGTLAGTGMLYNLLGEEESVPDYFTRSGDQVFFAIKYGQLWSAPALDFGAWYADPLGLGCEGSNGLAPQLTSSGDAKVGSILDLSLTDAAPNAAAILFLSLGTGYVDLGAGCALWVDPAALAVPLATDASGAYQLPAFFNAAQLGLHLSVQYAIADPGAPGGELTVSNALEIFVGS